MVFSTYLCNNCHSLDGTPTAGPTLQGLGSRQTREEITESIREPDAVIVEGFAPGIMAPALNAVRMGSTGQAGDNASQRRRADSIPMQ